MADEGFLGRGDWFGFATTVSVVVVGLISGMIAFYGSRKAGRQRVAEARLDWNNRYHALSTKLYKDIVESERLSARPRPLTVRRQRLLNEVREQALQILLMINPDSDNVAARAEYEVEKDCLRRLAGLGIKIDMDYVRKHRAVAKHAWQQAKSEF